MVSLNLPISNTLSIDKRNKNDFVVEEKILKLTKKEVIKSGEIKERIAAQQLKPGLNQILLLNLQEFTVLKSIFKET